MVLALAVLGDLLPLQPAAAQSSEIVVGAAQQRRLRLVTFNVEHHMSAERFSAWRAFCEPQQWRDPIDEATGLSNRPGDLTFCDALDGSDGRGNRVFAPVRDATQLASKRDALRTLIGKANADLVLLQEISDAAGAHELLGPQYTVVTTAELFHSPRLAQNLAIGWRKDAALKVSQPEVVGALALSGPDGRSTRPGLAVTLTLDNGHQLALLNVHLKAGCRSGRLDESPSRLPQRRERRHHACSIFQQQVTRLEDWVDQKLALGWGVIIGGDFNRDLPAENRQQLPARNDGSDRSAAPTNSSRIASLLAEINDEMPAGAWFELIRSGNTPRKSECHRGIDQFLVSRKVEALLRQPLAEHRTLVIAPDEPVTLDRVRPSDHCPQLLVLSFNPRLMTD